MGDPCAERRLRRRYRPLAVVLLAVAGPAAAAGPTVIPRVDEFIDAPRVLFGRTRAAIEARLGTPLAIRARESGDPRSAEELAYPGLRLRIHGTGALQQVRVIDARYPLPGGLNVGADRRRIEEFLGEPQQQDDHRMVYVYSDGYPDAVEFGFQDHRVYRIEWAYGIE